ncbi:hypothetical protein CBS63078_10211 [Aspergillus niger]|nr:hypothetical protein CBS63078_10211 [Aspergillus niger]KAI3025066.1 hypothetical protein CBS147347_5853 [Aspergillus niger]
MAEESFATALSSGEITVELFHQRHITYLHQIIRASAHNGALRRQLWMADTERQRRLIGEMAAANLSHHQQLHWEKVAHAQTRQALEVERNLHLQTRTIIDRQEHTLSNPRFFVDCDPTGDFTSQAFGSPRICHPEKVFPLDTSFQGRYLQDLILSRLIFPFIDVLCIFAEDIGGLGAARNLLLAWAKIGSASSLSHAVRPKVVIVVGATQSTTHDILDDEEFLHELLEAGDVPFLAAFGEVRICRLPPEGLSPEARFLGLAEDISRGLRDMRRIRDRHNVLFSATHLEAFFRLALEHISASPLSSFDFIRAARCQNPLDGAFTSHITNFLKLGNRTRAPYNIMASYIASAILMDAYPTGMHRTLDLC